ncbi:hypothetical protein [Asticcacaulis sp. AND118]|uniref:hypothetical protein n=1 Tax=Asticcacaulis sp. AND118 TaxID=2840468 RepID=UPI001CFFDE95|nr:hypothetical protein [Asticcacaulis sp. AND118]UDF03519.1 hypothetical protein LH365_00325 [Asticcacaulis sp. AND118]
MLGLLLLAACDAGPSAVLTDGKGQAPAEQVAPLEAAPQTPQTSQTPRATPPPIEAEIPAPRVENDAIRLTPGPKAEVTRTRYGDWPLWSSNRKYTAYENATYHYEKHGAEIGARSYEEWLAMVHGFIHTPPAGVETLARNNGDTLFYDKNRNVFAVMTKKGAPRTLFRPYEGAVYWQKQKQIEAERRTITRDNFDPGVD